MTKIDFERDGKPFRTIGILSRSDSNLMCAQCHVEYNCNPGFDPKTGTAIGFEDQRTNYFPWANVFDIQKKYADIGLKDFRHAITGAPLTKLQHPEMETFWGSKHERAGVECKDCHMPKVKTKAGKQATFHGQRSARYMLRDTCVRCHPYWSQEEAEYQVDAIQDYIRGKAEKGGVLAWPVDRHLHPCKRHGRQRGRPPGGVAAPRQGPHPLGVVDGRKQRRLPQPGSGTGIPGPVRRCLPAGNQGPRKSDRREKETLV